MRMAVIVIRCQRAQKRTLGDRDMMVGLGIRHVRDGVTHIPDACDSPDDEEPAGAAPEEPGSRLCGRILIRSSTHDRQRSLAPAGDSV
jgi:hypothetical protein